MTSYEFTVLNLKELNLAPENVNTLGDLIQETNEEIRNKNYLADEIKEVLNLYNKSNNEMFEELTHDEVKDYIDFIKYAMHQMLENLNEYFYEIYYNYEEVDYLNKPFEN